MVFSVENAIDECKERQSEGMSISNWKLEIANTELKAGIC